MPTEKESWGAGIALGSDWDFLIDPTGDLDFAEGDLELIKDISYRCAIALDDVLGAPLDVNLLADVEVRVQEVMNAEERIDRVLSITAEETSNSGEIRVKARIIADMSEHDLVFPLSNQ